MDKAGQTWHEVPVDQLQLDRLNPRLVEFSIGPDTPEAEVVECLWKNLAVDEVAMSIATQGFWRHEPLFAEEDEATGRLVVIEGNRRLAAVKLLLDPELRRAVGASRLPEASADVKAGLQTLPCQVTTRQDLWQFLAFKHVNGPAKWGSFAKAEYVSKVHNNYQVPLEQIAEQIGDRHLTVQRMYRAMMVLNQAEATNRFSRARQVDGHFSFSHLYTGLDYPGFKHYLSLKPEQQEDPAPVPAEKLDNLEQLCLWLYGDASKKIQSVMKSQHPDLKDLDEVLQSDEGVVALQSGLPLAVALDISRGDERIFRESLVAARRSLQRAQGTLATGYDGDLKLVAAVEDLYGMITDLLDRMERFNREQRRPRRRDPQDEE